MNHKDALESMVWQFGYQGVKDGKPMFATGGLSALEEAFSALGWDDPHFISEEGATCEVDGCMHPIASGQPWGYLYLSLCSVHSAMKRDGIERPPIKQYAITREATRNPITRQLT